MEIPRLSVVGEASFQQRPHARMQKAIFNWSDNLHAPIEVAGHPVGGSEVDLFVAVVPEIEDAGVLEKPPNDAYNSDSIADSGNSRPKAADAADDQIDLNAGLRSFVEMCNNVRVNERIDFRDDSTRHPRSGQRRFPVHHLREALTHVARCDEQVPE